MDLKYVMIVDKKFILIILLLILLFCLGVFIGRIVIAVTVKKKRV